MTGNKVQKGRLSAGLLLALGSRPNFIVRWSQIISFRAKRVNIHVTGERRGKLYFQL